MNRHLFRIVFNRSRNKLMAVQETASSVSGSSCAQTRTPRGVARRGRMASSIGSGLKCAAWAALWAGGLAALQAAASAQTRPPVARSAPPSMATAAAAPAPAVPTPLTASATAPDGQRPIIDAASNGVPIVHIAPPSNAGVSVNRFQDFNVGSLGLIENNSASSVQTQLGRWIAGNPQLGYVPARIIVNEVVGTTQSSLKGTIEVAGRRADVVISNPNGLVVDGLGFVNTSHATLTTGTTQYTQEGALQGVSVAQGQIKVEGGGLNAVNLEQLDLLARGFVIEGQVWAQNLNLLAGANQVPYASLGATPAATAQPGTGPAPLFAIDIKDLGGMNANQVYLLATEQGLGVNSTGRIAALQGNLQLAVNGDLTLKDTYAARGMTLASAGNVTLTGRTQTPAPDAGNAAGDIAITSTGTLTNFGMLDAAGIVTLDAAGLSNAGTLIQRSTAGVMALNARGNATNSGTVFSAGDLSIKARALTDTNGTVQAAGALSGTAQSIALAGTQLASNGALALTAEGEGLTTVDAQITAGAGATLAAAGLLSQTGTLLQGQRDITLRAGSIANRDSIVLANGTLAVTSPRQIDNTGGKLMGSAAVAIAAGSLINDASTASPSLIASDHATQLLTAGTLSNRGGVISAKTGLAIDTQGNALSNHHGVLVSDAGMSIAAGDIDSTAGQIVSRGGNADGLRVDSTGLLNDGGTLMSAGGLRITTGGLSNNAGTVAATGATSISAYATSNRAGVIRSGSGTTLSTQAFDNTSGSITSGDALALNTHAQALVNAAGQIGATDAVEIQAGDVDNRQGRIASGSQHVSVSASSLDNSDGVISGSIATSVQSAGTLSNAHGSIIADGVTTVRAASLDNSTGSIISNLAATTVTADQVNNRQGVISGGESVTLSTSQLLGNQFGRIVADNTVNLTATSFDNTQGTVAARRTQVSVGQGTLTNTGGQLIGSGTAANTLALQAGHIDNRGGTLITGAALAIDTHDHDFDNSGGTLQAGGALTIRAAQLNNAGGHLISLSATDIITSGAIENKAGEIGAAHTAVAGSTGNVRIVSNGQALVNDGGRIVAEGQLRLSGGAVSNAHGLVSASSDASLTIVGLDNIGGSVLAGQDLQVSAQGTVSNSGSMAAGRDAVITAGAIATNGTSTAPASATAGRDLRLEAALVSSQFATLQAGRDAALRADALANLSGAKVVAGHDLQIAGFSAGAGAVDNTRGALSAQGNVDVAAAMLSNDAGRIDAAGSVRITAATTSNRGGVITSAIGTSLATQSLDNRTGEISSAAVLAVDTRGYVLDNRGGRLTAVGDITLASGTLDNSGAGQIVSTAGSMAISTTDFANQGGSVYAQQAIDARVLGSVGNQSGSIVSGRSTSLSATSLENSQGHVISNQRDVTVTAGRIVNNQGTVSGANAVTLTARSDGLDNQGGQILSNGSMALQATGLNNIGGTVSGQDTRIELGTATLDNTTGKLIGNTTLRLSQGALTNRGGQIATKGALAVDTHGKVLDNDEGRISATGMLSLITGQFNNQDGTLYSASTTAITSQALDNTRGSISAQRSAGTEGSTGTVSVDTQAQPLDNTQGRIVAETTLDLSSGGLTNRMGVLGTTAASGQAHLRTADLDNTDGTISSGVLQIGSSGAFTNAGGNVRAAQGISLGARSLSNAISPTQKSNGAPVVGQVVAGRDLVLETSGELTNAQALIQAGGSASVQTASLDNAGALQAGNDLSVAASGSITNSGHVTAARDARVTAGSLSSAGTATDPASITAGHDITVASAHIANQRSALKAGNALSIQADTLDNHAGGVISAQAGLQLSGLRDTVVSIDNALGKVFAQGALNVAANALVNDAGTLGSASTVVIDAGATSNRGGIVASALGTTLGTQSFDNRGGEVSSNAGLSITTNGQSLTNQAGRVVASGDLIVRAGAVDNSASGQIGSSNANVTLAVASLRNDAGLVSANQDLSAQVAGWTSNLGGEIVAQQSLSLNAATVDNTRGRLVASGGSVAVDASQISNVSGLVSGKTFVALNAAPQTLDNTGGQIITDGSVSVRAAGLINREGAVSGQRTSVDVASGLLDNTAGKLVSSGALALSDGILINRGGQIATGGELAIDTHGQALDNGSGQIATGGALSISAGSINNQAGAIASDSMLVLRSQSLDNGQGRIVAASLLSVDAGAMNNRTGVIGTTSAHGSALLKTASLDNADGTISSGTLTLASTGAVTNAGGSIAAAQDASIQAESVVNAASGTRFSNSGIAFAGQIVTGRDLAITTSGTLGNSNASIQSGRNAALQVGSFTNDHGIVESQGGMDLSVSGAAVNRGVMRTADAANGPASAGALGLRAASFDNSGGTVSAATALSLSTGTLVNASGGMLQANAGTLILSATQTDNRTGTIASGADIQAITGALNNTGGTISAKTDLALDTRGGGLINNADANHDASILAGGTAVIQAESLANLKQGSTHALIAAQYLSVSAGSVTNTGTVAVGAIAGAADGTLSVATTGVFDNDGGTVQAQGALTLQAQNLSNRAGKVVAASASGSTLPSLSITTTGDLDNSQGGLIAALNGDASLNTQGAALANHHGGTVYASQALTLRSGELDNSASGVLQAGTAFNATTLGLSNNAGTVSASSASINTQGRALDNTQGVIQTTNDAALVTGALSNNGGTIAASGKLAITTTGTVDNTAGTISGTQGLALAAMGQAVINVGGTLKSALGDLSIASGSLVNDGGFIASSGTTSINAESSISNCATNVNGARVAGQIAGNDIVLAAATLDNTGGRVVADHDATITTTTRTDNTDGVISALHDMTLAAPLLVNAGGQIVANNAASISTGSSAVGGTISGNELTLNASGDYTNTGTVSARSRLALNANSIVNNGELSAITTRIAAAGTLTNSGLIDGGDTRVTATTLENTGRIYGDQLSIGGTSINNTGTGVIAARDALAIGAQALSNTGGGLIYAINDISIGGAVSGNADQGTMQRLLNASSTIEAGRDLRIGSTDLTNRNDALQVGSTTGTQAVNDTLIQPNGTTIRYRLDQLGWDSAYHGGVGHWVIDSSTYPIGVFGLSAKARAYTTTCTGSGESFDGCTTKLTYGPADPVWALFRTASPDYTGLVEPANPGGGALGGCLTISGGDTGSTDRDLSGACGLYWTAKDAYDAAVAQRDAVAADALDAKIVTFNNDVSVRMFDEWNEYHVTSRTTTAPVLTSSDPARLIAGRDLTLDGSGTKLNDNSVIVAGGALNPIGGSVDNRGVTGLQTVTEVGQVRHRETKYRGDLTGDYSEELTDWTAIVPAPVTTTVTLPSYRYEEHAAGSPNGPAVPNTASSGAAANGNGPTVGTPVNAPQPPTSAPGPTMHIITAAPTRTQQIAGPAVESVTREAFSGAVGSDAGVAPGSLSAVSTAVSTLLTASAAADIAAQQATGTARVSAADGGTVTARFSGFAGADSSAPVITAHASVAGATATAAAAKGTIAVPVVQRYTASNNDPKARDVILTVVPRLALPTSSLFRLDPRPDATYLVETDPRFTNYRDFLGSEYFERQLNLDPSRLLKRYGDGFEEQRMVDDQVLALTGRRYLSGYQSTEDEFKALMDAGVAFAKQYQLTPGVSLSAEQMALLTTDIVWLTTQTVTLPNGDTTQVLVPQLYLRQTRAQDLNITGALMSGGKVTLQTTDQLVNSGTMLGDRLALESDVDIVNQGQLRGADISARASNDLKNIGGLISGTGKTSVVNLSAGRDIVLQTSALDSSNADHSGTRATVDRIATVQGGTITLKAAQDLIARGAIVAAGGDLTATAGHDIVIDPVQGSYQITIATGGEVAGHAGHITESGTINQVSAFSAGNDVTLQAQRNVSMTGANVSAGGSASVTGANIVIATATDTLTREVDNVGGRSYIGATRSDQALVGGTVSAAKNITITATGIPSAGAGNLTLKGANINAADGLARLNATRDIMLLDATTESHTTMDSYSSDKGLLATADTTRSRSSTQTTSRGTSVSGQLVSIVADNDLGVQGGHVSGDTGVLLSAGRNLVAGEAQQRASSGNTEDVHKTGLASSFMGVPLPGSAGDKDAATQSVSSVSASTITSTSGGVRITSGGLTALQGVQVQAAKIISVEGGDVSITGASGSAGQTAERSTNGTNIGVTGIHDFGKGVDAQKDDKNSTGNTGLTRTTLNGQSVSIKATGANGSSGNITVSGTTVNAASLNTDAANQLNLDIQSTNQSIDKKSNGGDVAWQAVQGKGSSIDTAQYNQFNVGSFTHTEKSISVQVGQTQATSVTAPTSVLPRPADGAGETPAAPDTRLTLQSSITSLASQPGMAWMGQLQSDATLQGQIDWNTVTLAHDTWDYKQQGLTPAAAAVITAVVAYFTAGAASGIGAAAGDAAAVSVGEGVALEGSGAFLTGAGATISTAVGGAVTAGLGTLASEAAVALLNNKGDVGKALHDLGSSANVKGLASAMITGGVLAGLNLNPTGAPTAGGGASPFLDQLQSNLQAGAAKAVINSAIYGTSLEDNLRASLKSALIDTAAAQTANTIGDTFNSDSDLATNFANKVAHAIAGCAAGAARTDNAAGCSAGALGAAVGEISAEVYGRKSDTVQFASMVSAIAAALTGQDVNVASAAGGNAAANNHLNHTRPALLKASEQERLDSATKGCLSGTVAGACDQAAALVALSQQRDAALNAACAAGPSEQCSSLAREAVSFGNMVMVGKDGKLYVYPSSTPLASAATTPLDHSLDQQLGKSTAEGLLLESGNQFVGALIGVASKGIAATRNAVADVFASQGIPVDPTIVARIANNFGRDGDQFTAFADQLVRAESAGWVTASGKIWWPPGGGAVPGTETSVTLQVGQRLDRLGGTSDKSSFLSPIETSLGQRALSPATNAAMRDEFIVLKPINVEKSNIAPWFGQPGMGLQYDTSKGISMPIEELVEKGYLKKVGS